MDKVKKILVTLLIATAFSIGITGCKDNDKTTESSIKKDTKEVKKEAEAKKAEAEKALKTEHPEHPK